MAASQAQTQVSHTLCVPSARVTLADAVPSSWALGRTQSHSGAWALTTARNNAHARREQPVDAIQLHTPIEPSLMGWL